MIQVFRDKQNSDYWEDRWSNSGVDKGGFENKDIYPIKYAEMIVNEGDRILEAGCGAGRVYFHYKNLGFDIKGIEYSQNAVNNILEKDSYAEVIQGNITSLPYSDKSFNKILAFGLYHNIENKNDLKKSFSETSRVLENGGELVASVRFDSFENKLIERIVKNRSQKKNFDKFHRCHFSLQDMRQFLGSEMKISQVIYARNVSFLFKFDCFRLTELKSSNFKESKARSSGFKLNCFGQLIDNMLHKLLPTYFSNLLVIIAKKE